MRGVLGGRSAEMTDYSENDELLNSRRASAATVQSASAPSTTMRPTTLSRRLAI